MIGGESDSGANRTNRAGLMMSARMKTMFGGFDAGWA
jgi:hypothetical protein